METLEDIFEVIKFAKFLERYTDINPNGGIRHRIIGIKTNTIDKNTGLTEKDKTALKEGLKKYFGEAIKIIDQA
jgi:hypothetical protein